MKNLKYIDDFLKEEISQKFWEKDRGEIEIELLDAINDVKKYFNSNNFDKYSQSLNYAVEVFNKCSDYSKNHEDIMKDTIHDYLEDFSSALRIEELDDESKKILDYLLSEYDVNSNNEYIVKESRENSPGEDNSESVAFSIDDDDIHMFGNEGSQSDLVDLVRRNRVLVDTQNMLLWYNKRDEETKNILRTHFNIRPIKYGSNSGY